MIELLVHVPRYLKGCNYLVPLVKFVIKKMHEIDAATSISHDKFALNERKMKF